MEARTWFTLQSDSDELWVEVKCQSNQEIAGSPRNAFRCSLMGSPHGGRALNGLGGFTAYQPQSNHECREVPEPGSETAGAKLRRRKGNSPDRQLRSLNAMTKC